MSLHAKRQKSTHHAYLFAGLDFLIDVSNKPVFIEANSFPGVVLLDRVYGRVQPLEELVSVIDDQITVIVMERTFIEREDLRFFYNTLYNLTGGTCRLVLLKNGWSKNIPEALIDQDGKKLQKGTIITPLNLLKRRLSGDDRFAIINPFRVSDLTRDKWKTMQAVQSIEGMKTPQTHIFQTKEQLIQLAESMPFDELVIKPRFGQQGRDIFMIEKEKLNTLSIRDGDWLVQERIIVRKYNNQYWDVRTFVVNGIFSCAYKGISNNPVVNFGLEGTAAIVKKKLAARLAPLSEACVNAIELDSMNM